MARRMATAHNMAEPRFYGGCGVGECADCLPLYDVENNEVPGTDDPEVAAEYVAGLPLTCPDCGSTRVSPPDNDRFADCHDCGAAYDPTQED